MLRTQGLAVPDIPPEADALTAALAYADAGWYLLPVKRGSKHPGSVVGNGWQRQSSRDPHQIAAWFAGSDHGIALHCGRSGALAFDVDRPEKLPEALTRQLDTAPYQSTRPDVPGRGHYVFAMPPGRTLGNSTGQLGSGWGEIRGANGVIIAAPTLHPNGGRYSWQRCGPVPPLPDELTTLLPDASPANDAASDAATAAFLAEHTGNERPELLECLASKLADRITAGESRHDSAVKAMVGAMKEARAGFYPARLAAKRIADLFLPAMAAPFDPARRAVTDARSELYGILAWAIGQANAADLAEVRQRLDAKVPAPNVIDIPGLPGDAGPALKLTRLADVVPQPISWLWPGYLPVGKLVTLDGDPGLGKSTLALQFAAIVTTGGTWPDGTKCEHSGAVVVMSAEDGLADTIRPRLDAAGADVTRVHSVDGVPIDDEGTLRPPTLADVVALEHAITATGARLLIIDVLMAYLPTGTNAHKDQDIRRTLSALAKVAERTGCTILLLRHLNKDSGRAPLYRGGGSIGIVGAARAGLLVAADPDDGERRVLASIKSNLGATPRSLAYTLVAAPNNPDVARVSWEGVTDFTAADLLTDHTPSARDEVERWLWQFLADGRKRATEGYVTGEALGYSTDKIKRAKKALGVKAVRDGEAGAWFWERPDQENTVDNCPPIPTASLPYSLAGQAISDTRESVQGSKEAGAGSNGYQAPSIAPPTGVGRCGECGYHVPTQGHREGCRLLRPVESEPPAVTPNVDAGDNETSRLEPHQTADIATKAAKGLDVNGGPLPWNASLRPRIGM